MAFAAAPTVSVSVNASTSDQAIDLGSPVQIVSTTSVSSGDLNEHWLEVREPQGAWSWEGWLTSEPWLGNLNGNRSVSQKSASFTPTAAGVYYFRATANSASDSRWIESPLVRVEVRAPAGNPNPNPPPPPPPPPPNAGADAVTINVNGSESDQVVNLGATIKVTGVASASKGDLDEHWLEVMNPQGSWSWEGWLVGEPWGGSRSGDGHTSQKTGFITPTAPGVYTFRSEYNTASDPSWRSSAFIRVEVRPPGSNPPPPEPPQPPQPPPPPPSSNLFRSDGTVDPALYAAYLNQRDATTFSARLGPTFSQLNPNAAEDRPTHGGPQKRWAPPPWFPRIYEFELGPPNGPLPDVDYWSESGQTLLIPDDPNHPGVSRMQVFAYYSHSFAISPRYDFSGGDRDFFGDYYGYRDALGKAPTGAVAAVRNYSMLQNEALIVTKDGLLGAGLTQTSRADGDWPLPVMVLPQNKKPTDIAVTSSNELALISVWDVNTQKGQLAVIALQGNCLPYHTMRRTSQPNQGSWSRFKLLGYVDLPFATPSAVAAASNSSWNGPSQTASRTLGEVADWLEFSHVRDGMRVGEEQWTAVFASKGYALVASRLESKVCIVDLSPYLNYVRESYLVHDDATYRAICAQEDAGIFPATFSERPDLRPAVVWEKAIASPTALLAGQRIDRWTTDYFKAYVASEDGNVHVINTSSLMARYGWQQVGALAETGTFYVGKNPTSMCFTRHTEQRSLSIMPIQSNGVPETADPLSNTFYVACRGDRKVVAVCSYRERGMVYREIKDTRLNDPVAVSVAGRGNIVTIADYHGKGIHSFRVGSLSDNGSYGYSATYPVQNPGYDFDYAGFLGLTGFPFLLNSANVN
jgi:hypothetical protein